MSDDGDGDEKDKERGEMKSRRVEEKRVATGGSIDYRDVVP